MGIWQQVETCWIDQYERNLDSAEAVATGAK